MEGKPYAPKGNMWLKAVNYWQTLQSDSDAIFDKIVEMDANKIKPMVTWGTSPEMVTDVDGVIPVSARGSMPQALSYMGLKEGTAIKDITLDKVFIGSCTN